MSGNIFGISVSALNAAQAGLATTEHNIANANTPGFNRQQVSLGARPAQFTGAGYLGQGVDVTSVTRVYSEFQGRQVLNEQGQSAQLNTYYAQIQQIDNMVSDPNSGLSPAIQEFFSAVNNVSSNPESVPARQSMISGANFLTSRFQSLNQRMIDMNSSVNSQIGYSVTQINSYAKQISTLNQNIVMAQSANGQPPNDLLDQRDQMVTQLNQEIKATVVKQTDGSFSVFVGNGQPLVVGVQTFGMTAQMSVSDPSKLDVAYTYYNGATTAIQQSSLQGGNLGGLLAFRDEALTNSQNALGRVAMGVTGTFNQQHQLGQDLNGALGGNFFAQPVPLVSANTTNTGNGVVSTGVASAAGYTALTGSDYSLKFDGTNYSLTRLTDSAVVFNGTAAALLATPVDGLTINVSTAPATGDGFLIRPTVNAARDIAVSVNDPAKIAAAAPVRTNATLSNLGTGKISAATVNQPNPVTPNPAHPLTDLNLQQAVTIKFSSPTTYDVTGTGVGLPAIGVAYTAGANISYNGWTMQISGTPSATDTFTIGSNTNATTDGRNSLLLAGLQIQNTMAGGTTSYQGAYSQLVSYVGNKTRELEVTSKAQASMVEQSVQAQQSFSGVNLDEEAANLLRYQRAYQAAGKALQIANTMFDTILSLGK